MYPPRPFRLDETHGMRLQPDVKIEAYSDGLNWTSLLVSVQREMPFEGNFRFSKDLLLVLHRDGPVQLESRYDRHGKGRIVPAGAIHIISPGTELGLKLSSSLETVHVYVRRSVIEEVALYMVGGAAQTEVPCMIVEGDEILRALIDASASALADETRGTAIFADYIARTLSGHLIQTYSRAKRVGWSTGGSDFSAVLETAIDYMASNMRAPLNIAEIASATNRSPSYLTRMFRRDVGMPPHRYLIAMRIDKAKHLLAKTSMSIADIAIECGFSRQEHLTHVFRRLCGTTPAAYRHRDRYRART